MNDVQAQKLIFVIEALTKAIQVNGVAIKEIAHHLQSMRAPDGHDGILVFKEDS